MNLKSLTITLDSLFVYYKTVGRFRSIETTLLFQTSIIKFSPITTRIFLMRLPAKISSNLSISERKREMQVARNGPRAHLTYSNIDRSLVPSVVHGERHGGGAHQVPFNRDVVHYPVVALSIVAA